MGDAWLPIGISILTLAALWVWERYFGGDGGDRP